MTKRLPCPPAPGPLEAYAVLFDDLFGTLAGAAAGFRELLAGLLLPRDCNKTLTCLAGTEPMVGAQHAAVQRLQFFLSESTWDGEQINARRLQLLLADPATSRTGRMTRPSAPSCRSGPSWLTRRQRASSSVRSSPTAPTATTTPSALNCPTPACRS
jgi:hypothetical protein